MDLAFAAQVADAVRSVAPEYGLTPSPTDAYVTGHAMIESGWGAHMPSGSNNLFGFKPGSGWTGATVSAATFEYDASGNRYDIVAAFRAYPDLAGSIRDYLHAISRWPRYQGAFQALQAGDPDYMEILASEGWATADPSEYGRSWRSVVDRIASAIGAHPVAVAGGGAFALLAGAAFAWWWLRRRG